MALLRRSAERLTAEFGAAPCCGRRRATSCQPAATASSRRFGFAPDASSAGDQLAEDHFWRRSRIDADIAPPSKMVVAWVSSPAPLPSNASTQSIRRSGTAQSPPRATPRPSLRLRGRFRSGRFSGLPAAEPAPHGDVPVPSERTVSNDHVDCVRTVSKKICGHIESTFAHGEGKWGPVGKIAIDERRLGSLKFRSVERSPAATALARPTQPTTFGSPAYSPHFARRPPARSRLRRA